MTHHILIVDDDRRIREMLRRNLLADGWHVDSAVDGEQALELLKQNKPDLCVLDVNMPGKSGFDVCNEAREAGMNLPIILLTARGELHDRVTGLDAGADDYLAKPFEWQELAARMRALLRRTSAQSSGGADATFLSPGTGRADDSEHVVRAGDVTIDRRAHTCKRGDRIIELSKREFDLLELLVRNVGVTIERWKIISEVWDDSIDIESNSVEVYIGYLRKKLEADGEQRILHTVRGVGYVVRELPS